MVRQSVIKFDEPARYTIYFMRRPSNKFIEVLDPGKIQTNAYCQSELTNITVEVKDQAQLFSINNSIYDTRYSLIRVECQNCTKKID